MPIPKIIYQTWKTKKLPEKVEEVRRNIHNKNSGYEMILFDDNDMEIFIRENYDTRVLNAYKQLAVGAAKADLWRYLILYKNGGVYLDIDSDITGDLSEIITPFEDALITREKNHGLFVQWFLAFCPKHPILKYTIDMCIHNIESRSSYDIAKLTGPNVFSSAVNRFVYEKIGIKHPYDLSDSVINNQLVLSFASPTCSFYNFDLGAYGNYKHTEAELLYSASNHTYWRDERKVFND